MKNSKLSTPGQFTLHAIVNRISINSLPSATQKNSFIINDVPSDLKVNTDEQMLATVVGTLLDTLITYSENCCIRISAKLFEKVALIHLKENQKLNQFAVSRKLKEVQQLAGMIGGAVSIGNDGDKSTSIVFSFSNNLSLAA
jgi:hypothetical protein